MNALARVGAFTVVLVVVSGMAAAVGATVGPIRSDPPSRHGKHSDAEPHRDAGHGADHSADDSSAGTPAGLQVSERGYSLELLNQRFLPDPRTRLRFRILDDSGNAITGFDRQHGKQLHLIVVRRDLASFQHVHPEMAVDGTWSVDVDLSEAGTYRVFTDFQPSGAQSGLTLGHDLSVQGRYLPQPLPTADATTSTGGYHVTLDGRLVPGETSRLTLTVTRNGEPVTDLQPYLEAFGHLVALRDGDLAYLHVHPDGAPGDGETEPGPEITFFAEVPSTGTYRLFLDFKHRDAVHTAAFTATAGGTDAPSADAPSADAPTEPPAHGTHAH